MTTVDVPAGQPDVGRWRYVGGVERIYMHVPVTVQHGAVIEHAGIPADDGCWEEAEPDAEVTHLPDNTALDVPDTAPAAVEHPTAVLEDGLPDDGEQEQVEIEHHETVGE